MFNYNLYNYNNVFVDSIKEAEAAPADFSGNPLFFFNKKENEIYFKQFNMQTGQIYFGKYVFEPIKEEAKAASEDNSAVMEALNRLEDKCDYLYEIVNKKLDCHVADAPRNDKAQKGKVDKDDE